MKINATRLGATLTMLGLVVGSRAAKADLITALDSSLALTAQAQCGFTPMVTDTDSHSQGSSLNAMSVAVSAYSSSNSPAPNASLLVAANGSATWTSASTGEVTFTDTGWTGVRANGFAYLYNGPGWNYTFVSNVTGSFVINYAVTAQGTSSTTSLPLTGLNGFYLYEGSGATPPSNATLETGLNTTGTATLAISAGNSYTVQIQDFANLALGIGTTDAHMDGTFDFNVEPTIQSVPEPSSATVTVAVSLLVGIAAAIKRQRRSSAPSLA